MTENQKVINLREQDTLRHSFPEAKGHEKILASCKRNCLKMRLILMNGNEFFGEITQFDRWTITLKDDYGNRRTYYKHAIESFEAVKH